MMASTAEISGDCSSARVLSIRGDEVEIEVRRDSACEHCAEHGSCGMMLGEGNKTLVTVAVNKSSAAPGDLVEISLDGSVVTWAAVLLYIFPLCGLFLGVILGSLSSENIGSEFSSTMIIALYGMVGLVVFLLIARFMSRKLKFFRDGRPVVTRIIEKNTV